MRLLHLGVVFSHALLRVSTKFPFESSYVNSVFPDTSVIMLMTMQDVGAALTGLPHATLPCCNTE